MKKFLLVIGILCLMTTNALALPGTLDDLADYIALGATGVVIDDKLFYDFAYTGSASFGVTPIAASDIGVTQITTAFNPGLQFQAPWTVAQGQSLDSAISFFVQVLPGGNAISDVNASMAGFNAIPAGVVGVAETFSLGSTFLGSLGLFSDGTTNVTYAESILASPTSGPLFVLKDISVNGNALTGGFASVSIVRDQFSEVPIPPSALLLGSGLLGLVGWRRFRKV